MTLQELEALVAAIGDLTVELAEFDSLLRDLGHPEIPEAIWDRLASITSALDNEYAAADEERRPLDFNDDSQVYHYGQGYEEEEDER